ncbi:CobW family GTP-binding protein [Ruegeria marina]|uniref:GTPase, G3E family n=1 Tax=Ruegeria marina TaxID=639004 RepID=A0A1G6JIS0_9RHOB|nr:CobW family GTP-binding protein [Ruegeria marina]SDC17826.1 GTPase, G3E family [Ruegeria marina]
MRLPLTVISGYLGAGKTTLINRLLAEEHGLRLLVMVNDFGAINIDARLIAAADDDMIALTNGCVCCTMGADLFMALGDVLDRDPRPDHLVIEASGIADPAAIANAARAEPDLSYAGIVTLIDGLNGAALLADPLIAPQVAQQMRVADLLVLTKADSPDAELTEALRQNGIPGPLSLPRAAPLAPLLFGVMPRPGNHAAVPHPAYVGWSCPAPAPMSRTALRDKLNMRPAGIYRLKGFVPGSDGMTEVHVVGTHADLRPAQTGNAGLVALGLADRIGPAEIEAWWAS